MTPIDLEEIVEVVVTAFATYPYWTWLEPDDTLRRAVMEPYYTGDVADVLAAEASMAVDGELPGTLDAVALWWWSDGDDDMFDGPAVTTVPGAPGERLHRAMSAMADMAPDGPYWYLDVLACRPERRGTGLGARLLRHGLSRADAQNATVYLETSDPRNVGMYEHFGFETTAQVTVEGLWLCGMTRPPTPR